MARTVDDILADELRKLGGIGSKWVARRQRTMGGTAALSLNVPPEQVASAARELLASIGVLLEDEPVPALPPLQAIVGSGGFNLNPTFVAIEITPDGATGSRVIVTGQAKEGLIKQHAGERAAQRIAEQLAAAFA